MSSKNKKKLAVSAPPALQDAPPPARPWGGADWLCLLLLLGATLAFFSKGVLHPAGMIREDAAYMFQPFYEYEDAELAAGRFPHWDPYVSCGAPHHAALQGAVLYPLRWPLFQLGYVNGYMVSLCLHYFLTGAFTFLLLRTLLKCGPAASLLGAISFAFGGYTLGHVTHLNFFQADPWFILTILLVGHALVRRRWIYAVAAAIPVGLMGLAGTVHVLLILGYGLGVWALGETAVGAVAFFRRYSQFRDAPASERRSALVELARPLATLAIALGLGGLIGLAQLLPGQVQSGLSTRTQAGWGYITEFSIEPVRGVMRLIVPFYYGNNHLGYWGENNFHGHAFYTGMVPLMFALCAVVLCRRNRWTPRLAVMVVVTALVAAGQYLPVYRLLYDYCPEFNRLRNPSRLFVWAELCLTCLGAIGFDAALRAGRQQLSKRAGAVALVVGGLLLAVLAGGLLSLSHLADDPSGALADVKEFAARQPPAAGPLQVQAAQSMPAKVIRQKDPLTWAQIALAAASIAAVAAFVGVPRVRGWAMGAGLVALLLADLGCFSGGMLYLTKDRQVETDLPPHVQFLQQNLGLQRYEDATGLEDIGIDFYRGMQYRIRFVRSGGVGVLHNPRQDLFVHAAHGYPRLMSLAGVKYIVTTAPIASMPLVYQGRCQDSNICISQNASAMERAFLAPGAFLAPPGTDPERILGELAMGKSDLRDVAFVEGPATPLPPPSSPQPRGTVTFVGPDLPGRYQMNTDAPGDRQLVLTETWHPEWKCSIDNEDAPIYLTDYTFMSVRVPAGRHDVCFYYDPRSFRTGVKGSVVGILLTGGLLVGAAWRNRRRRQGEAAGGPVASA